MLLILFGVAVLTNQAFAAVTLVQEPEDVCFGDTVTLTCSVIDDGGAPTLRWQSVNESFKDTYSRHSSPGANVSFILGFAIILTNKSGNMLTSTATLTNASESVTLMCTDGRGNTKKSNIVIIQKLNFCAKQFLPLHNGNIKVSWDPQMMSPQCCTSYSLELTPENSSFYSPLLFNTTNSSAIVKNLKPDVTYAARVVCKTPEGINLISDPRDIWNNTSSFSAEARLNYSTVTTDPSILIEVSVVVHHEVYSRGLYSPMFSVKNIIECCSASIDCLIDKRNNLCKYNITEIQHSNIIVYIVSDFGYSAKLNISEDFQVIIKKIMELNEKLLQVETQMTMCSLNIAVTVPLCVLLGVAIVIIIVLVVLLCRLKPCSSQNQEQSFEMSTPSSPGNNCT